MARKPLYTTIDLSGPFFTKDPSKTFRANARSMMRALVIEAQVDIDAQLIPGDSSRAEVSALGGHVSSRVAAGVPYTPGHSKTGAILANVYVPNWGYTPKQARSLMAAYSRVAKTTGAFKRTAQRLRKAKALNVAELLKGLT